MSETLVENHMAMEEITPLIDELRDSHDLDGDVELLAAKRLEQAVDMFGTIAATVPPDQLDGTVADYVEHSQHEAKDHPGEFGKAIAVGVEEVYTHPDDSVRTAAELFEAPTGELGEALRDVENVRGEAAVEEIVEHIERSGQADQASFEKLELPAGINERIYEAYEASSFEQSPEVQEAIKSYYEDHYKLGNVIEKIIDGKTENLTAGLIDESIQNSFLKETAKSLLILERDDTLFQMQSIIRDDLFMENAVAAETVSEKELEYRVGLLERLGNVAEAEGFAYSETSQNTGETYRLWRAKDGEYSHQRRNDQPLDTARQLNIDQKRRSEQLWNDTRHAGQLEFHNTGNFGAVSRAGFVLRSRTRQKELDGSFYSQVGVYNNRNGNNMHSNLPHFSETYDAIGYKQQYTAKNGESDHTHVPATAAIPLAEIIKTAPYARDAQYAEVRLKNPVDLAKVTVKDMIGSIGAQGDDHPGTHGEDRVFMADYREDHAAEASKYDLEFGFTGMVIMTESERALGNVFGHGYGYAQEVFVPEDHDAQADAIKQLQASSRSNPKYAGKVIVPLRRGVIEFEAEAASRNGRSSRLKKVVSHAAA